MYPFTAMGGMELDGKKNHRTKGFFFDRGQDIKTLWRKMGLLIYKTIVSKLNFLTIKWPTDILENLF